MIKRTVVALALGLAATAVFADEPSPTPKKLKVEKKKFLQSFRQTLTPKVCDDPSAALRVCYGMSETDCQAQFGAAIDACSAQETKDLPEVIQYSQPSELRDLGKRIAKCAALSYVDKNQPRLDKKKCPKMETPVKPLLKSQLKSPLKSIEQD